MAGFLDFLGMGPQAPVTPPVPVPQPGGEMGAMPYTAMQNAVPPEVAALQKPTNDPNEINARKEGWMEVVRRISADPNIMRAVGMFGAAVGQPMQAGQSTMGHIAQAAVVGRSAYDFGKQAEFDRSRALKKDALDEQSTIANIEQSRAATATSQERTRGLREQNTVAELTREQAIARIKAEADKADIDLKNARTKQDKDAILLRREQEQQKILDSIPDTVKKQAVLDDLKKGGYEIQRLQAQITQSNAAAGASSASARASNARARQDELENEGLAALTPTQRNAQKNSRGNVSAQVQMAEWYKANVKAADPKLTDQQASEKAIEWLSSKKVDNAEQYIKWAETNERQKGETEEQHVERYKKTLALVNGASPSAPVAPGSGRPGGAPQPAAPKAGEVRRGYRFKGGDPSKPENWEKV